MYKHRFEIEQESKVLDKELQGLRSQAVEVRAKLGQQLDDKYTRKKVLLDKIAYAKAKTNEYAIMCSSSVLLTNITYRYWEATQKCSNDHEHLRIPILHLLEVLKADKHIMQNNGLIDVVQDLVLPDILGMGLIRAFVFLLTVLFSIQALHKKELWN